VPVGEPVAGRDGGGQRLRRRRRQRCGRFAKRQVGFAEGREDPEPAAGPCLHRPGLAQIAAGVAMAGNAVPAQDAFDRVAERNSPRAIEAAFYSGLALMARNQPDRALERFDRVAAAQSPLSGYASLMLATLYAERGDGGSQARSELSKAEDANLPDAVLRTVRGRVFAADNDLAAAGDALRAAVNADANYPAARLEYGLLLIRQGSVNEGLTQLERYLDLVGRQDRTSNQIGLLVDQLRQTQALAGGTPGPTAQAQ